MPVLTNFLAATTLDEIKVAKQEEYVAQLSAFRDAVNNMQQTFRIRITKDSEFGEKLLKKEEVVYRKLWKEVGFIPADFDKTCLNTTMPYNALTNLSRYPVTKISNLKSIANDLGFVILPIEYISMEEIIKTYRKQNSEYAKTIKRAYDEFIRTLDNCKDYIRKQQIYILAPVSFYDPWKDVSAECILPKYFSPQLQELLRPLGMILPTQRNLYAMVKKSEKSYVELNAVMEKNFQEVEESIQACHERLDWVEDLTRKLTNRVGELEGRVGELEGRVGEFEGRVGEFEGRVEMLEHKNANLARNMQVLELKEAKLEHMLYCLLDPIVFSTNKSVDISKVSCDNEEARIGLCFGTDMPIDFFIERGMTIINDKRFEHITYALKI